MAKRTIVLCVSVFLLSSGMGAYGAEVRSFTEAQGSLAEIYAKFNQATKSFDIKEMKKYLSSAEREKLDLSSPEVLNQLPEDEREFMIEMIEWLKSEAAKDYKVVRQKIEPDKGKAILYLKREDSDFPYGLVTFVKENGIWKIEGESWSNKPKD